MSGSKAPVTQSELTRYAKAMRAAGFDGLRMVIEKPDGTKVSIVAGDAAVDAERDEIDAMIEKVPDP